MKTTKPYQTIRLLWLAVICLLCVTPSLVAQGEKVSKRIKPNTCEEAMLFLDMAAIEAGKDKDGYIILIARLGDGERSRAISRRRLEMAKDYLINLRGWNRIVLASGERVKGRGSLELFVNGKLLYVLLYPKNQNISCAGLG
jgi:hypothetical protein